MINANSKQVGGNHYKGQEYQHWDVVIAMGFDYLVGNATKYLWRLGKKGGPEKAIEDITKAIHYLEKKREVMLAEVSMTSQPEFMVDEVEDMTGYVNQDR